MNTVERVVTLILRDPDDTDVADLSTITILTSLKSEDEIIAAIKEASKDYLNTPEGHKTYSDNGGSFNYGDFDLNVTDMFCIPHGFRRMDNKSELIELDFNTQIARPEEKSIGDKGMAIAQEHIKKMNPSSWDGTGNQPVNFNPIICTYSIDDVSELDISFEKDEQDGWIHLCELRDKESEEIIDILSGYGIDSFQNLADTINDICKGRL